MSNMSNMSNASLYKVLKMDRKWNLERISRSEQASVLEEV